MSDPIDVKIDVSRPGQGTVVVGGIDVSRAVLDVSFQAGAGAVPEVILNLVPDAIRLEGLAEVGVSVPRDRAGDLVEWLTGLDRDRVIAEAWERAGNAGLAAEPMSSLIDVLIGHARRAQ